MTIGDAAQHKNRITEQVGTSNGGQRLNLNLGFLLRRGWPITFAIKMGNSYVSFQDRSFRSRDTLLELWFRLLALNLPHDQYKRESWIHELRDEWLFQASGMWNGVISPQLDEYCTTQERIEVVLSASDRLMRRIRECGEYVGGHELSLIGLGQFEADYPIGHFEQMHERFHALLTGAPLPPSPKVIPTPTEQECVQDATSNGG